MVDQPTAALIGAAIGASGAVTAQIIAAIFAQRTNGKRFEWERETAQRRETTEQETRFINDKRELFARFLAAHTVYDTKLLEVWDTPPEERDETVYDFQELQRSHGDALVLLSQEIVLLAPSLQQSCARVMGTSYKSAILAFKDDEELFTDMNSRYYKARKDCQKDMSEHLGIRVPSSDRPFRPGTGLARGRDPS